MKVAVDDRGIENALRRLKRKLKNDRFFILYREMQYYKKPSTVAREKKNRGIRREYFRNLKKKAEK